MDVIRDDSIAIFIVHHLLNGQLAKLPTILDSLLTGIANTTSTAIRVEGGGSGEPQNGRQRLYQH